MTWGLLIAQSILLVATLAGVWLVNDMWSKFTKRLIEDYSASQRKLIDDSAKQGQQTVALWRKSVTEVNASWDDAVRSALGHPPRRRGQLVEIKPDADPTKGDPT